MIPVKESLKQQAKHKATLKIVDDIISKEITGVKQNVEHNVQFRRTSNNTEFRLSRGKSLSDMNKVKLQAKTARNMYESPLLSSNQLQKLNSVRTTSQQIITQMYKSTKINYSSQLDQPFVNKLQLLAQLNNENWIKKPQLSEILSSYKFTKHELKKQISYKSQSSAQPLYNPKKYCKNDILLLSKWYKNTLLQLQNNSVLKNGDYITKVYYLHIAVIHEFIRLLSLESNDKSEVLQQVIAGMFCLFDQIVEIQHKTSQQQFKKNRSEMDDLKQMLDQNQQSLQEKLNIFKKRITQYERKYNQLAVVYFSIKKINRQILSENKSLQQALQNLISTYDILKLQHYKLVTRLVEQNKIHQQGNRFFFVNKFNKPQMITHFIAGKQQYQSYSKSIDNIRIIDTQLAKYWSKIQQTFEIQKMIPEQLLFPQKHQCCIQTDIRQLYCSDKSVQNYSLKSHISDISLQQQEHIQGFLNKEINSQKQKQRRNNDLVITLKELYQQVYQQNLEIKKSNDELISNMRYLSNQNSSLKKVIEDQKKMVSRKVQLLKELRQQNDRILFQLADKDELLRISLQEKLKTAKNYANQRINNQFFIKNQRELKNNLQNIKKQLNQQISQQQSIVKKLKSKINKACIVINNYLDIIQTNVDKRYLQIGKKLEEIFKEELKRQERDANIFLTKT